MEIIPLVYIKQGKLHSEQNGGVLSIDDLFQRTEKDTMLYVIDLDGIEHNNPNLELYQKLTEHCILWIDNGPRRIDDVMDTIMSGATTLTIRQEIWPAMDIPAILEFTDDEVFIGLDATGADRNQIITFFPPEVGVVVYNKNPQIPDDFTFSSYLKDLSMKHKIYLYTTNLGTAQTWTDRGIAGIIVDLNKKKGENNGI
jgi:hypothetical protein